ncbi:hypothetical protein HMI54_015251 [Coelomomyces lativittatus]|nr:hypothetical protein HMI54_015251 [Coelomomyces lativittatus]
MMESTAVCPEGRISPNDLGLWDDAHVGPLKRITDFVHSLGGKIGVQLSHAGRKASTYPPYLAPTQRGWIPPSEGGWNVVGPSPVPYSSIHGVPQPIEDPSSLPHLFVLAAQRAEKAGFDVIELHAAHGYLLHSFLSPLTNLRDDAYGGTLPHRAHLVVSLVKLLRQQLSPSTLLFIRFSCTDWMATSSWTIEEVKQVVGWIQEDVDAIDCSSGMLHPDQTMVDTHPGFQVPFAQTIKHTFPLPTIAVGRITDPVQANTILLNEAADFIMMAREMLRDNWLYRASKVLNTPIRLPVQYERAKEELPNSAS